MTHDQLLLEETDEKDSELFHVVIKRACEPLETLLPGLSDQLWRQNQHGSGVFAQEPDALRLTRLCCISSSR